MPIYPSDQHTLIRIARFANILDDANNALSPVKINAWSANLATFGAATATIFAWFSGHASQIADLWGPVGGWLAQAHITHHYDKRERNKQAERMAAIAEEGGK